MVFEGKLLTNIMIVDLFFFSGAVWRVKKKEVAYFATINYVFKV